MICFGIFFKKSVIGLFELFCPRALRKGPVSWRLENIFEQNIPCGPFLLWSWNLYSVMMKKNAKRGKVAKKPRPIKISVGRASHFVAFTADICITEEFSIRLKLDTYNSSSKVSSHCIFYYEFFVPQPTTQWRNNLAKGNFAQFIPIS